MPRAILKDGKIHLTDPIPSQWRDGQLLRIEADQIPSQLIDVEARLAEFDKLCEETDSESDDQLQSAINDIRREGKEQIRREMKLP